MKPVSSPRLQGTFDKLLVCKALSSIPTTVFCFFFFFFAKNNSASNGTEQLHVNENVILAFAGFS